MYTANTIFIIQWMIFQFILMQSTLLEKTSGKFFGPNSAGPVCIAHPTATPGQSYNWKQSGPFLWLTVYSMLCVIRDGELGSGSCSKIWLSFSVCLFARHYISSVLKLYGKHFGLTVTLHCCCCCTCLKTLSSFYLAKLLAEFTGRVNELGPWTRVVETGLKICVCAR